MIIDKGSIPIKNVFYMLLYAFSEFDEHENKEINCEDVDDIFDLLAEIFIIYISKQLKRGLHREYILQNDTLTTLRGKLNTNGTIRNFVSQKRRLDCEYDEFSEDNIFNRVLKSTALLLLRAEGVDTNRKVKLKQLMHFFDNVSIVDLKAVRWDSMRYDRNNRTYEFLINLSHFIANNLLLTTERGDYKMKIFLDKLMQMLFQRFVLRYYKLNHDKDAKAKEINWDNSEPASELLPRMQSDITLKTPKGRFLIIDTKYYTSTLHTNMGKSTIRNSHIYQIYTYVANLNNEKGEDWYGKVDGMLLYAKTQNEDWAPWRLVTSNGNNIMFHTLDLNKDFEDIKKQLDELINYDHVK